MNYVKAGLLSDILNTFKKLSGKLANFLDSLSVTVEDVKENSDGSVSYTLVGGDGSKLFAETKPIDGKPGHFNITVYTQDKKKKKEMKDVHEDKFEQAFTRAVDELLGVTLEDWSKSKPDDDLSSAKHINMKLSKITSATSTRIQLKAIKADYDIADAYNDALNVLNDDEVCDMVEDNTCLQVSVMPDNYEVATCGSFTVQDCAKQLVACTYQLLSIFQHIHWNSYGEDFLIIHKYCDEQIKYLQEQVDLYAEICCEMCDGVDTPYMMLQSGMITGTVRNSYLASEGFNEAKAAAEMYITYINAMYVNFPRDVQSELDSTIRHWNKEINYILKRTNKFTYSGEGTCLL